MTRDEIVKLARRADLWLTSDERIAAVERFAALVAAAEREACVQACEARYMGDNNREDMEARRCSAAIRARSNT